LISDWENGRIGGPRPQIDEDQLDFAQFFLNLTLHPFGSTAPSHSVSAGNGWSSDPNA
jgi:hypothetical protein